MESYGHVQIETLAKRYQTRVRKGLFRSERRTVEALKGISLEIHPGEVFGLLGPNGAGKTTLIKCLTTLLVPSSGSARINGFELGRQDEQVRATIGCMLMGERGLYWKLTGRENLLFFAALYHLPPAERERRCGEIIERLGLGDFVDRPVETYSSGQKMKLAFGKALINDAPLLILDEPTNTLDLPSARELRAAVRELHREGKTVIYTTHIMSEAEEMCDRLAIVDRGELIALGTARELKASLGRRQVVRIEGQIPDLAGSAVGELPGVERASLSQVNGHRLLEVTLGEQGADLSRVIEQLSRQGTVIQRIEPDEVSLEDVFMAHTGRTLAEADEEARP